jgi:hypothetical protein
VPQRHRYTIKQHATNKETAEHASYLEYDDDEIASTSEETKTHVEHDTSGVQGLRPRRPRAP